MITLALEKPVLREAKDGILLNELLQIGIYHRVLLPYWHGVGDVVMILAVIDYLRHKNPDIQIDLGLCRGLDQESFVPDAVLLDGDWREKALTLGYDLVYPLNFPLEALGDTSLTKAEICCVQEIGIPPICGHKSITPKKLVAVTFQMTSVPWVANADKEVAEKIWKDIKDAGCVPMECLIPHVFHNPINERYDFVDAHLRSCAPKLDTLMAFLGRCDYFVGVVGGPFHLSLSILGPSRVMLLEKDLKAGHFTKEKIATANLKNYSGEVKEFLKGLSIGN